MTMSSRRPFSRCWYNAAPVMTLLMTMSSCLIIHAQSGQALGNECALFWHTFHTKLLLTWFESTALLYTTEQVALSRHNHDWHGCTNLANIDSVTQWDGYITQKTPVGPIFTRFLHILSRKMRSFLMDAHTATKASKRIQLHHCIPSLILMSFCGIEQLRYLFWCCFDNMKSNHLIRRFQNMSVPMKDNKCFRSCILEFHI